MLRLFNIWKVRLELVSWVKLAWMPLSLKLLAETVNCVIVAVPWVCTSRPRCGELATKFDVEIVAAVTADEPEASKRKEFAPKVSLRLLNVLPVTFIAVSGARAAVVVVADVDVVVGALLMLVLVMLSVP